MATPPPRILLSPPHVGRAEREALLRAFDSNWISTAGPEIAAFEDQMAALIGRPCVALSSGTAGLHLALRLTGVSPGDTVLCQTFTFVATANPILYERAAPCFIDSETDTWNLCPGVLEDALHTLARRGIRPKALLLVHLYGMPARLAEILAICRRHEIPVIEDAAESLGATVAGFPTGAFGKAGVFSFNGNKIITTAGGGMVAVESESDAARLRKWSTQSREPAIHYEHAELGFNHRMSNLLAAVGRAQLTGLPAKIARRRQIAAVYQSHLAQIEGLSLQPEAPQNRANRWLSCLVVDERIHPGGRDRIIARLAANGIESRPLWKPMHRQPLFAGSPYFGGTVADRLFATGLCLPSSSALTEAEQAEIIDHIRGCLQPVCRPPRKPTRRVSACARPSLSPTDPVRRNARARKARQNLATGGADSEPGRQDPEDGERNPWKASQRNLEP